jgi:hypothetical protein
MNYASEKPLLWKGMPLKEGFHFIRKTGRHRYFGGTCSVCNLQFTTQHPIQLKCRVCLRLKDRDLAVGSEWRPLNDRYEVSPDGQVRMIGSIIRLRPWKHVVSGHLYVSLHKFSKKMVHLFVMQAWGPAQSPNTECRHLDGNPENNHIDNLQWGTRLENINDFRAHTGRHMRSIITDAQKKEMARLYRSGVRRREIAKRFECGLWVVDKAVSKSGSQHI